MTAPNLPCILPASVVSALGACEWAETGPGPRPVGFGLRDAVGSGSSHQELKFPPATDLGTWRWRREKPPGLG